VPFAVFEQVFEADAEGQRVWDKSPVERTVYDPEALHGVAPECKLISLKVLDANGEGRVTDIMRALVYVRQHLNADPKILRVHGVNLSVGYDFDAQMFACGQSPLCVEVDRLVKSGVVVVAAAGNTGYGNAQASERDTKVGLSNTINDPGNAALAITVGSTHRDSPHTYGVSFFSSKGPTGDGRLKPDLVAPGERITSCAARAKCEKLGIPVRKGVAAYVDDSGTSMAAPHVSGAVAAFLSIRREFIQRPEEVKKIFIDSATSLARERYFQGNGLVDLMRAIQTRSSTRRRSPTSSFSRTGGITTGRKRCRSIRASSQRWPRCSPTTSFRRRATCGSALPASFGRRSCGRTTRRTRLRRT
jgi:subtilisin family serine protease